MKDQLGSPHRTPAYPFVPQVPWYELDVAQDGCQVVWLPRRQVIHNAHPVPQREQALDQMRPDETGASSDECDRP
jgi:hypothetical protein